MITLTNITYTAKQLIVSLICNHPKVVLLGIFILLITPGFASLFG